MLCPRTGRARAEGRRAGRQEGLPEEMPRCVGVLTLVGHPPPLHTHLTHLWQL